MIPIDSFPRRPLYARRRRRYAPLAPFATFQRYKQDTCTRGIRIFSPRISSFSAWLISFFLAGRSGVKSIGPVKNSGRIWVSVHSSTLLCIRLIHPGVLQFKFNLPRIRTCEFMCILITQHRGGRLYRAFRCPGRERVMSCTFRPATGYISPTYQTPTSTRSVLRLSASVRGTYRTTSFPHPINGRISGIRQIPMNRTFFRYRGISLDDVIVKNGQLLRRTDLNFYTAHLNVSNASTSLIYIIRFCSVKIFTTNINS